MVDIIITGDFCPLNIKDELINKKEILFEKLINHIKDSDIAITNVECPFTETYKSIEKIGPNLKEKKEKVEILKNIFNVATLANNHILDYGKQGLIDTIISLNQNGIKTVGAGTNQQLASRPLIVKNGNVKTAILNYAEQEFNIAPNENAGANIFDLIKVCNDIEKVRKITPIIIVIIHGGIEGYALPSPEFSKKLRFISKFSPSVIVCHHTHRYSGYEIVNNVPIFYSLGNFIFDYYKMQKKEYWHEGFALRIKIKNNGIYNSFNLIPFFQSKNKPGVELMVGLEYEKFIKNISILNKIISSTKELEIHFNNYVKKFGIHRLAGLLFKNRLMRKLFRYNLLNRFFMLFYSYHSIYNHLSCDAHREVLIKYLLNKIRE